jgi:hypothetical protein
MNPEDIMLQEISQAQKEKCHLMLPEFAIYKVKLVEMEGRRLAVGGMCRGNVQMLVKDLQLGWVSSGDMMDSVVTIVGNI